MATQFKQVYDYDPNAVKAVVSNEQITVPSTAPYVVYLKHIPKLDSPSSVVISGLTEVAGTPVSGQFKVNYYDSGLGKVEFSAASASLTYSVSYKACGTVIQADDINNLQTAINPITLESLTYQTPTGLSKLLSLPNALAGLDAAVKLDGIEEFTNSNGFCKRYPNGEQICRGSYWFSNNVTQDQSITITFPALFVSTPIMTIGGRSDGSDPLYNFLSVCGGAINSSSGWLAVKRVSGSSYGMLITWEAKGRWK